MLLSRHRNSIQRIAAVTLCIAGVSVAAAAQRPPQTSRRAVPDSANVAPEFPALLRSAGVSGSAIVRLEVDTNGLSPRASRKLLRADHQLFELVVQHALDSWKFRRALRNGTPVTDTLVIEVHFDAGADGFSSLLASKFRNFSSPTPGKWRYVIGQAELALNAPALDSLTATAASVAVLDTLLAGIVRRDSLYPIRIACVTLSNGNKDAEPTVADLVRLNRRGLAVVAERRCPRTFGSMIRYVDSAGRFTPDPPGEDPFRFRITSIRAHSATEVLVEVTENHATSGAIHNCVAVSDLVQPNSWKGRCQVRSYFVH